MAGSSVCILQYSGQEAFFHLCFPFRVCVSHVRGSHSWEKVFLVCKNSNVRQERIFFQEAHTPFSLLYNPGVVSGTQALPGEIGGSSRKSQQNEYPAVGVPVASFRQDPCQHPA